MRPEKETRNDIVTATTQKLLKHEIFVLSYKSSTKVLTAKPENER